MIAKPRNWIVFIYALIVAGCAVQYPKQEAEVVVAPPESTQKVPSAVYPEKKPAPEPRQHQVPLSQAAENLLKQARQENRAGNWQSALTKAERAQRLSPKSPGVYQVLAEIWQRQKKTYKAEQFYRKAISLAGRNKRLLSELWQAVAVILQNSGNIEGAARARKRAHSMR
ncbi:MAG: hypothetical protein CSA50_01260 [Gammaproteobacteria bacterium]|nr:MAG: hypothetical protein CSA50_01260 [Gammaproteobacteria bacterium]